MKGTNPTWMGDSTWPNGGRHPGGRFHRLQRHGAGRMLPGTRIPKHCGPCGAHAASGSRHADDRHHRLEDPQAYTAILKTQRKYILKPSWNIMEYICEDTRVKFDEFEKKVGAKGTKTNIPRPRWNQDPPNPSWAIGRAQSPWRMAVRLPAAFSFSESSNGLLAVADPRRIHESSISERSGSGRWNRHRALPPSQVNFSWEALGPMASK